MNLSNKELIERAERKPPRSASPRLPYLTNNALIRLHMDGRFTQCKPSIPMRAQTPKKKKKEFLKSVKTNNEICVCGHELRYHVSVGFKTCLASPQCKCEKFKKEGSQ